MATLHSLDTVSADPRPSTHHHDAVRRSESVSMDEEISPSSSSSESESRPTKAKSTRPKMVTRKSSGTIITHSDDPNIELEEQDYGPEDARTMSPRRSSEEVDRMGENARNALILQAKQLQDSLLQIVDRVESARSDHEKLESGNRFLQSYIGELMQTSKLTASGAGKKKGKTGK